MSLSQSPVLKSGASPSALSHIHAAGETCPTCDQPIPHDRFEEIKEKIETRQSAHTAQIAARLQEQFKREKADALEQAGLEAAAALTAQVAGAREEERRAAEVAANEKLAEAARINQEAQAAMQTRIDQAEAAKTAAEESGNALKAQLDQARRDGEAAIQKAKEDAEANAVTIREDARKQAEAAVQEKIVGLEQARQQSEASLQARIKEAEDARAAAVQSSAELQVQLNQARADGETAIEKAKQDADARVNTARQEATAAAEATAQEKIAGAEQAKAEAEAKALAAEEQARVLKETHESQIEARVSEVRTALEADKAQAVNAAKAEAYEDKLKLSEQLAEVQRKLEKKTADELGEGAEINLLEALRSAFPDDKFVHVGKGNAGADIIHTVMHSGMACGKIIFDSKDHGQWRYDFATKLATDKIAEGADHAILSTRKFPQGMRQLDVVEGVILANPARVVALVQVVREHIVKSHALRLSNEDKAQKSVELYTFITSAQCTDLLDRIDMHAQELLEMQVKEQKAHEKVWKDQGILYRSIQKTGADLSNRIDTILGIAGNAKEAVNDQ
jgi:hypothetical protein